MFDGFQHFIRKFIPNFKRLFLIDGLGAVLTALLIGLGLTSINEYIGMPLKTLEALASVAILFAIYSFSCHFLLRKNWKPFLTVIIIANLSYCCATILLLFHHSNDLTLLGFTYFILEILVIISLVYIEISILRNPSHFY